MEIGEREHSVFNSHQISKNWKVHRHGLLTRKPENPYGKSLFSPIRWRVVASCTVSIDIHRATPTFAQTIATIQTLFLDPWKSYQVCWKLKDTTHREIGGSAATAAFLLFTTFNSWALHFFPLSIQWKKNWLNSFDHFHKNDFCFRWSKWCLKISKKVSFVFFQQIVYVQWDKYIFIIGYLI